MFTQRGMVEVFTILSGFTHRIPTHLISDFGRRRRRSARPRDAADDVVYEPASNMYDLTMIMLVRFLVRFLVR